MVTVQDMMIGILDQPAWLVYLIVAAVVFAEDAFFAGFVIPGETAAILGGVTASLGHTSLAWMILVVCAAAILGDSVGYEVGRTLGARLLRHRALERHGHRVEKAQDFLRRRGGSAVFLGRWTAFFRAMMPALAGSARMPYGTFLAWNAVGGIAWGATVVIAGNLAGRSYEKVAHYLGSGAAIVVAAVVVGALIVWHFRRERAEAG
ncbi:MAG: DedA family protein [Tetrasphaera sp.]|nr:DedA family protein [Tetrasphaera sp.]